MKALITGRIVSETNKAIQHLKVLKRNVLPRLHCANGFRRIRKKGETYSFIFSPELNYGNRREINRALAYFGEAFINGPELVQLALEILNFDLRRKKKQVVSRIKKLLEKYDNLDTCH